MELIPELVFDNDNIVFEMICDVINTRTGVFEMICDYLIV